MMQGIFMANQMQYIKESSTLTQWRYVASEDNPPPTRGLKSKELIASNWFSGPSFLWRDSLPSGEIKVGELNTKYPEVCKGFVNLTLTTANSLAECFLKFSSWTKAIARLTRFVKAPTTRLQVWKKDKKLNTQLLPLFKG